MPDFNLGGYAYRSLDTGEIRTYEQDKEIALLKVQLKDACHTIDENNNSMFILRQRIEFLTKKNNELSEDNQRISTGKLEENNQSLKNIIGYFYSKRNYGKS